MTYFCHFYILWFSADFICCSFAFGIQQARHCQFKCGVEATHNYNISGELQTKDYLTKARKINQMK